MEQLILRRTGISVYDFIKPLKLPNLKKLKIADNQLLDESLCFLASGEWSLLEYLDLYNTGIAEKGVEDLVNKSNWPNLQVLDMSMNHIISKELKI